MDVIFLIEINSTGGAVLQGVRGTVTIDGVEEEFSDLNYHLSNEKDDFQDVIKDQ